MKNLFLVLFSMLFFSNCQKDEEDPNSTMVSTVMGFAYIDNEGNDLLDPENPDAYDASDIEVYEIEDGKKFYTYSRGEFTKIYFRQDKNKYRLTVPVYFTYPVDNKRFTTYVELSETDIDTLECELEKLSYGLFLTKVWYNGDKVFDWDIWGDTYAEITK